MKKILLFLIISSYILSAQQLSYIIPDIGAPGFNTYVEMIAPHDATDNFGNDGLYLNNTGDVLRVELVNDTDSLKLTFGPLIVSWNGRLISSHVFVHPNVNPNSEIWSDLRNEFRIPFRIYVNGSYTNIDTFYIVKPTQLGDLTGTAHWELGGGRIGLRSRRGAMIIEGNTVLANNNYGISMADCDPYVDGNQAYLPFIMLSKGDIRGAGTSSYITASGRTKHGGPGGGGGGGNFCDAYILNRSIIGQDGGDGFAAGGAGGRNNSGGGEPDAFKSPGNGTGANGASLNGVSPPANAWTESSGGGTGHPFGISGQGCGDGNNCQPDGGYGGGSGFRQNQRGGAGGHRTAGNNTGTNNGGKVYGNFDGIPIAGGSGGGSGNPNAPGACSGEGGGGGGAIRIAAPSISSLSVRANGSDGASSSNGTGGAGSGGYIEMGTKLSLLTSNLNVIGGNGGMGGMGLLRVDAPVKFGVNYQPSGVERSQGLTSDTTNQVYKQFRVTGSKNQDVDSLRLYIRAEDGVWTLDTVLFNLRGNTSWRRDFSMPGTDSIYYFCVVADKQYSEQQQYTNTIQYTMSQSAANIFMKNKTPEIAGDTVRKLKMLACPGSFVEDTFKIYNSGDASLQLDFQSAAFSPGGRGFSFQQPTNQSWVLPKDSIEVVVRYTYQTGQSGRIVDTLLVPHNDIFADNNPYRIALVVDLDSVNFTLTNPSLVGIDTLDFGTFCYNDSLDKTFRINNESSIELKLIEVLEGSSNFYQINDLSSSIDINNYATGRVRFVPDRKGRFEAKLIYISDSCNAVLDTLILIGEAVSGEYLYTKPVRRIIDTLDLGPYCVGGTISSFFLVENNGGQDLTYNGTQTINNTDYSISARSSGFIPKAKWDTVFFDFWPKKKGPIFAKIGINTTQCSGYTDTLVLKSTGVTAELSYSGNGNFGVVSKDIRDTITTWLSNNGTADMLVESLKPLSPPFSYVYVNPALPVLLKPGEKIQIDIEFYPRNDGVFYDTLGLNSILTDTTCIDDKKFPLVGISTSSQVILSTDLLDYGVLEFCDTKEDSVEISNPTTVEVTLSNPRITGPDDTYFEISQGPPSNIIPIGGSAWYHIRFKPRLGPAGVKVAQFVVNTDFPKNPEMIVDLRGEQENLRINMTPPDYTFGTVPIGVQRVQTIRLTNNGKIDQNLIDVIVGHPDMSASPKAAFLAANGGFVDVDVTYQPTTAGNADTRVWFKFRKNCEDSIQTNIYAEGKEGQVLVTSRIFFELKPPCSDVIDSTFEVTNTGASLVVIDSMKIEGTDKDLFSFVDGIVLPAILDSAESIRRTLQFSPGISNYGIKSAFVVTYTNVGGKTKTDTTQLQAEKRKFVVIDPALLDFSQVVVGQMKELDYRISNVGNSDITITGIIPPAYAAEYVFNPDPTGSIIQAGQFLDFKMQFLPSASVRFDDSFGVEATYITMCKDSTLADLTGEGIPPLNTRIIIDTKVDVDPRLYEIDIPIYGYIVNPVPQVDDLEFRAMISYNLSLFALKSITNGTILLDSTFDTYRFIEFEVTGLSLDNDTAIIANLVGRPLLGNAEETAINWESFNWKDSLAFADTDTIPGKLGIKICSEGGPRLLDPGLPLTMSVSPNPAEDEIVIELTFLETGRHSIDIFDAGGASRSLGIFNVSLDGSKEYSFRTSLRDFSSGFYYVVLSSPTNRIVKPLYIIK